MLDLILFIMSSCHFTASNFKTTQPFKKSHILLYKKSFHLSTICRLTLNAIHGKIFKERIDCVVDILVAVYNGEKYLKAQLESVINQTYKEFNIIIRDDGSTDSSLDIIKEFKSLYPEKVQIIEGKPSKSAKNNFFELMNYAASDYIMFCDQDDIWLENKVELTLSKMKEAEDLNVKTTPVLCHTDLTVVDKDLNTIHPSFYKMQKFDISKTTLNRALVQNIVTGCTVMINKPLLNLAKGTNAEDIIMHDWWLFLIASAFGKVEVVNTPTILYRQHESNQLGAKRIAPMKNSDMYTSVINTICQSAIFSARFKTVLSEEQIAMIYAYSNIKSENKTKRLFILNKYKIYKSPLIKNIFQQIITLKLK